MDPVGRPADPFAIECAGLQKHYGSNRALRGIDLTLRPGRVLALLGPNGAGKTTLVKILTTLSRPTAGRARVLGFDVERDPLSVRRVIGVVPQENNLDRLLTARENLQIHARMHGMAPAAYEPAIAAHLERTNLASRADEPPEDFSGGMQRRLVIARALLHDPRILFLDEPTTGLDPQSRQYVWDLVRRMRGEKTVLLTTHHMEEAEALADDVAIVDEGRLLCQGTPQEIKREVFPEPTFRITLTRDESLNACAAAIRGELGVDVTIEVTDPHTLDIHPARRPDLFSLIPRIVSPGDLRHLGYMEPTLEAVFLKLTGKHIRDDQ